jgi:hypothetical protein
MNISNENVRLILMENFWPKKVCVKMMPKYRTNNLLERKREIYANILQRIEGMTNG